VVESESVTVVTSLLAATSSVETVVATVESPDPHADTTMAVTTTAIETRMSDRMGDGRRMSS
jgi:Rieske Fe-S protein